MPLFTHKPTIWRISRMTASKTALIVTMIVAVPAIGAVVLAQKTTQSPEQIITEQGGTQVVTISSQAELQRVLPRLNGGSTVKLMTGYYPIIAANRITTRGTITITSADPAKPAVIGQLNVRNSSGILFRNLHLQARPSEGFFPFMVINSENIAFDQIKVEGLRGTAAPRKEGAAMMVRASRNISVTASEFSNSRHGLALLQVEGLKVTDTIFHDLQTDGLRGGGVSEALIAGNMFTNYHPAEGDHPDGIQLWSTHQKRPGRNIVIRDNLVVRGSGAPTQGIFVRDTKSQMPFENVEITGNLIVGSLYNGIAINGVNGARIENNEVIAFPGRKSWIRVDNGQNVLLKGNRAMSYVLRGQNKNLEQSRNNITHQTSSKLGQRINEWAMEKSAFPVKETSLYRQIVAQNQE